MNRTLIQHFFKDKKSFILTYIINTGILILFFNVIHPSKLEIFYPIVLSLFFLAIFIVIEWGKYYPFNNKLDQHNQDHFDLKSVTYEQKKVSNFIYSLYQKYEREINQLKGSQEENIQFLSQWMHNLKTPISVIDLLIQKFSTQQTIPHEVLRNIRAENERLFSSIEQVLNMIRFENFAMDYEPRSIELVSSVKKVINEKKNLFIYNSVFPAVTTEQNYSVITDQKWNDFILDQIISNAIKYSSDGVNNKKLLFTIYQEKEYTCLVIQDEGVGIPPYDLSRVFDPFFTGENGRKFRNSTGIGLYICKKIADKLGHEIQISSKINSGTEVTIKYLSKM